MGKIQTNEVYAIPQVKNNWTWKNLRVRAYCYYENDSKNGSKYGALYTYFVVDNKKKICPFGWHMPSDEEWGVLAMSLGAEFPIIGLIGKDWRIYFNPWSSRG